MDQILLNDNGANKSFFYQFDCPRDNLPYVCSPVNLDAGCKPARVERMLARYRERIGHRVDASFRSHTNRGHVLLDKRRMRKTKT